MKINEVEAQVGITKKNIRFYEEQGLLSPRRNSENGYRDYGEAEVAALRQIKLMRKLGVPLEEIRRMQAGATFQDKQKNDLKPVRYAGAIVMALLTTGLMAGIIALMVWGFTVDPADAPPLALVAVLAAIPGVVILGVLLALFQRIKEIQKGEEDDAKNY